MTYQERHRKRDQVDYTHWKEPKLIVKILLEFFSHHQDTHISLLFDCLRALCGTQPGRMVDGNTIVHLLTISEPLKYVTEKSIRLQTRRRWSLHWLTRRRRSTRARTSDTRTRR